MLYSDSASGRFSRHCIKFPHDRFSPLNYTGDQRFGPRAGATKRRVSPVERSRFYEAGGGDSRSCRMVKSIRYDYAVIRGFDEVSPG
jgi:hypothetical protein